MTETLSLYELNNLIRSIIERSLPDTFLVTAEIASCDIKNHCYLTLVDKDEDMIRAEIKAVIWANRYRTIAQEFESSTGVKLAKGIRILFTAEVSFHERYGLKLNILDIDPSFTVGELAVRRKEILERLTKEGLKDRNRELEFPLVPQRIGIISSSTAAGYEDLMTHLLNNSYGYRFSCKLYESVMQGDRAERSIITALEHCGTEFSQLDIVVIVRGGGAQADLHCFDSYEIAKAIASLPLPVISGIGHERDVTVVDEVANLRAKTPTAVADLVITRVKNFEDMIDSLTHNIVHGTHKLASHINDKISYLAGNLESSARRDLLDNVHRLNLFMMGLKYSSKLIKSERERLMLRENNINNLNPVNVLKRGYSITYNNGKAVKSVADAEVGDSLRTVLYKGELISKVERMKK